MAHVRRGPRNFLIGGIDNCISASRRKKVTHVCVEYTVFHQMINNIEGDRQVGPEQARMVYKTITVVKEKTLRLIVHKLLLTKLNGGSGDIKADIARIAGERQLMTVPQPNSITELILFSATKLLRNSPFASAMTPYEPAPLVPPRA